MNQDLTTKLNRDRWYMYKQIIGLLEYKKRDSRYWNGGLFNCGDIGSVVISRDGDHWHGAWYNPIDTEEFIENNQPPGTATKKQHQKIMDKWWPEYLKEVEEEKKIIQYPAREVESVGTIEGNPAYKITCSRCCDKVLYVKGATWKLECHCTLLWVVTETDSGISAIGKRQ